MMPIYLLTVRDSHFPADPTPTCWRRVVIARGEHWARLAAKTVALGSPGLEFPDLWLDADAVTCINISATHTTLAGVVCEEWI